VRCDEFREKIFAYFEGSLTEKEQLSFSRHLTECASCRKELQSAREMDSLLAEKMPAYAEEIIPSPDFVSLLQNSRPWYAPTKPISGGFRQWLFAPWQSRRIVTAALSLALVVSLVVLVPRAYFIQESNITAPAGSITSPESAKNNGGVLSTTGSTEPVLRTEQSTTPAAESFDSSSGAVPEDTFTTAATPGLMSVPPTPTTDIAGTILLDISGNGTVASAPFVVNTSPWQLQWSVINGPGDITIEIIDADSKAILGQLANNFVSSNVLANNTTVYNLTGNLSLLVTADSTTAWRVKVIPAS